MKVVSLKKKLEFKRLFKEGRRAYQDHLNIIYLFLDYTDEAKSLKIAYVVSKKVSRKAVIRNKIKRRLRAAVQQVLKESPEAFNSLSTSLLIAIRPSDKIVKASFQQVSLEVKKSFEQLLR